MYFRVAIEISRGPLQAHKTNGIPGQHTVSVFRWLIVPPAYLFKRSFFLYFFISYFNAWISSFCFILIVSTYPFSIWVANSTVEYSAFKCG